MVDEVDRDSLWIFAEHGCTAREVLELKVSGATNAMIALELDVVAIPGQVTGGGTATITSPSMPQ